MPHARRDNMDAGLQACVAGSRSGRASWQTPFRRHCELPVLARPILLMDHEQRKRWRCRVDQAKRIHRGEHRSPMFFAHGGSAALDPPYL